MDFHHRGRIVKGKESRQPIAWVSVDVAAQHLGTSPDALRRMLERRAVKAADGGIEADVNGVRGRKLGRIWRVRLSEAWLGKGDAA
jgi:hypothetical protein